MKERAEKELHIEGPALPDIAGKIEHGKQEYCLYDGEGTRMFVYSHKRRLTDILIRVNKTYCCCNIRFNFVSKGTIIVV